MVPLLDPMAQNAPLVEELTAACSRVLNSGCYINGPEIETFETSIGKWIGAPHAIAVSSGTDALLVALMALGIGPGDEVLVPTFTFFATAGCVARLGATPVFTDVCPVCYNLDLEDAHRKITTRTRAIIPVHLFGQAADMDPIVQFAKDHQLSLVEDAAQAIGAEYGGRKVGTFGDAAIFSFFPSKNLGGFGDAGLITTTSSELAEKMRRLRMHGMHPRYIHSIIGGNFRMDPMQAALLSVKLPHLSTYCQGRAANALEYQRRLRTLANVHICSEVHRSRCGGSQGIETAFKSIDANLILPGVEPDREHVWNQFTVQVPRQRRDALREHLRQRGIGCEVYYPLCLHEQECFQGLSRGGESIRAATWLAASVLSIPVYPELTQSQRDEVIRAIEDWVAAR